jgi:putative membrane protein PagO
LSRARTPILIGWVVMCLIWSSTWMVIKVGLRQAPPLTGVALRFMVAALLVLGIVRARQLTLPRTRHFVLYGLFLGICQVGVPYVLVYWSEQRISSGLTAVLYSSMPLVVAVLARFRLGTPLTRPKLLGIGIGMLGVWVIFADSLRLGGTQGSVGVVSVLVSVLFAGFASVMAKKHGGAYHPIVALLIPFAIAGLLVLLPAALLERSNPFRYDAATWGAIFYLAGVGSVTAFSLFYWVIRYVDVTLVSYQTFVIPILAVLLGALFLHETLSPRVGLGTACVLVGVAVATLFTPRASRVAQRSSREVATDAGVTTDASGQAAEK